ncbi:MAG TPA: response regulator transcription factor [Frankiaceae bacterium]|nr:response regulator transcription factor [Frankiaceae bacterium]
MPPIRIALVDDAEEMRLLVSLSLTLTGDFAVVGEAGNGRDAVAIAARHRPDLMLLDLSMPEMDGLEALPLVLKASPCTRVVVFSGFDEAQLGREARALGALGYIEKGTPLEELGARLKAYLDGRLQSGP